ncbi:MAG: TOBE domain-containing protein [Chromatiales bacterium]|jgi:sn-glycerol 3-phosphate transport system ATP-binding protein|nr:TOBE domain-containing protein [Chromatiales bacterium]
MRIEIRRLQRELGITSIYVTHDQVEAMTLADRLVAMNAGRAEQVGKPMEIYERPSTQFVAGFIGSPPMNVLPVSLAGSTLTCAGIAPSNLPPTAYGAAAATRGVRPEHLTISEAGNPGVLNATVDMTEPLGPESWCTPQLPRMAHALPARLHPQYQVKVGETIGLSPDIAQASLFDADGASLNWQ